MRIYCHPRSGWRRRYGALAVAAAAAIAAAIPSARADSPADAKTRTCKTREGYVAVTGGRVWYQIVGEGDAVPLLVLHGGPGVLHGGPGVPHDYLEPIAELCHRRPVIFYDQLGCGKSDHPTGKSLWRLDRFVAELRQVRSALGLKRLHILGHSWGSMVLTDYALTHPGGLESVILSDPLCSVRLWLKEASRLKSELPSEIQTRDRSA